MKLILDNIIFSLQRSGGISVVWRELLSRARQDAELELTELDVDHRCLERYRDPVWHGTEKTIFHSSYFRIITKANVRNVTTVHDLTYHYYRSGLAKQVHLWQEARAVNHSAGIICVSEHTKKDLLMHYPHLQEEQTHVIYNGVSDAFTMRSCNNPTPFESKAYLLYVGNRSAQYKNFHCAVNVAKHVHLPLVIVGDALTVNEHKLLEAELGTGQYWSKIYPNQDELVTIYNHAYCLLYPSSYEGFGLPIIEAQRTGCLVIGQAISSVPEVMGKGGICVPHNANNAIVEKAMIDVLGEMLNGRIDTQLLQEEGLRNSLSYTWERTYQQVKKVYQEVYSK